MFFYCFSISSTSFPCFPCSSLPSPILSSTSHTSNTSLQVPKTHKTSPKTPNPSSCLIHACKPRLGQAITHNEIHPHVPASEHIFSWRTPFGSCHQADVAQRLPPPLLESAMMAVQGALAPNTKSTYAAGPYTLLNFATNGASSKRLICWLTTPSYVPS